MPKEYALEVKIINQDNRVRVRLEPKVSFELVGGKEKYRELIIWRGDILRICNLNGNYAIRVGEKLKYDFDKLTEIVTEKTLLRG